MWLLEPTNCNHNDKCIRYIDRNRNRILHCAVLLRK